LLDIKLIRENPEMVRANLERRQQPEKLELLDQVITADKRWRELTTKVNQLRKRRNEVSQEIAQVMKAKKDASSLKLEASRIPEEIKVIESELEERQVFVKNGLMRLPNLLHESVPYGKDDKDNVVVKVWGEPPKFDFLPSSHADLSQSLGIADFERAA
jgi:seryl-tRNA synthetase